MDKLPEDLIVQIYLYLKPPDICALSLLSVFHKKIEEKYSDTIWRRFIIPSAHSYMKSDYKKNFFTTPLCRESEYYVFHINDLDYQPYFNKLKDVTAQFSKRKVDFFKNQALLFTLVKEDPIYVGLILYHTDINLLPSINPLLLKQFLQIQPKAKDYILQHKNPEIIKHSASLSLSK